MIILDKILNSTSTILNIYFMSVFMQIQIHYYVCFTFPQWQNNCLGGLTGRFSMCIRLCSDKLLWRLKHFPQYGHERGVSPV